MIAYVGCYAADTDPDSGGIAAVELDSDGTALGVIARTTEPRQAGYLAYAAATAVLYAVDERKTDGRGPVGEPASVHAFALDHRGELARLGARPAPGPFPTFLAVDEHRRHLLCVSHGGFDHVEHIVRTPDGWGVEYLYDDSALLYYRIEQDGRIGDLADVQVMAGHGPDPNSSAQAGGHAQSGPHAHCAVIDPSGAFALVCDKGTDQIHTYALGERLELVATLALPPETGPRHLAFDVTTGHALVTCEFSSRLTSLAFDAASGKLRPLDSVSTVEPGYQGLNEPAEVRVHPAGGFVYLNNRGEDSLTWFRIAPDGALTRLGHVMLAASLHPGVAARSFALDPAGSFLVLADRPANLLRTYRIDPASGAPTEHSTLHLPQPAFVALVEAPLVIGEHHA